MIAAGDHSRAKKEKRKKEGKFKKKILSSTKNLEDYIDFVALCSLCIKACAECNAFCMSARLLISI